MIEGFRKLPKQTKLKVICGLLLVFGVLFFLNYGLYRMIALLTGRLLSFLIVLSLYYSNGRILVRGLAFPGTTLLMRRQLENDFCKNMAQGVLRSIVDLKNCIEMFMGPVTQIDLERTEILNLACQKTMLMILSLEQ
jgi:hypothetical protein